MARTFKKESKKKSEEKRKRLENKKRSQRRSVKRKLNNPEIMDYEDFYELDVSDFD